MKSRYLVFAATAVFTVAGATSASAKTKTASLKVSTVKPAAKYITGKATPGAKVKVTRYAKTYATGKATKAGTFKLKAKLSIKGNWHYRATATKAGFKTKVIHFGVKANKPKTTSTAEVATLQSQITALNDKLAQLGSATSTTNTTDLQSQITALNSKIADLESQLAQAKTSNSTGANTSTATKPSGSTSTATTTNTDDAVFQAKVKELNDQYKTVINKLAADQTLFQNANQPIASIEGIIQHYQQQIVEDQANLANDPDNQKLQLAVADDQNALTSAQQKLVDIKAANEKVGNGIMDLKNEIDSLAAQRDDLDKQLNDLYNS